MRRRLTVIFDFDGVLIDSEPLMRLAFERAYSEIMGVSGGPIEIFLTHMGEALPRIMDKMQLPRAMCEPYRAFCREHIAEVRLFPGARELLAWAAARGWRLALFTGKDRPRTEQLLAHFELSHYFSLLLCSEEITRPKPDPEGILQIQAALGAAREDTIMIGDSVNDIVSGERAGVRTIGVTWGIKPELVRNECKAGWYADDFQALRAVLEKMGS